MKKKLPLLSVLIPVKDQEKYIGRCVRSVLSQSLDRNKFEVIVVNDGSKDKTSYALGLFKDEIKVINNKKTLGLPASLNIGIKHSKAEFFFKRLNN